MTGQLIVEKSETVISREIPSSAVEEIGFLLSGDAEDFVSFAVQAFR